MQRELTLTRRMGGTAPGQGHDRMCVQVTPLIEAICRSSPLRCQVPEGQALTFIIT